MLEFDTYKVEVELTSPMLGTTPKNPEIYKNFIESKKPATTTESESDLIEIAEGKGWTGFQKDDTGLFLYDYMMKGFLKGAANAVRENQSLNAVRKHVVDFINIEPRRIYFTPNITEPHGTIEQAITGWTPTGKITALQRCDVINEGAKFTCTLKVLKNKVVDENILKDLLSYGEWQGLLKFRQGGFGKFKYTLTKMDRPVVVTVSGQDPSTVIKMEKPKMNKRGRPHKSG